MQPVSRQLQQLDYNNGNVGVFYVVLPRSYLEENLSTPLVVGSVDKSSARMALWIEPEPVKLKNLRC
jgi:hypothetical protein